MTHARQAPPSDRPLRLSCVLDVALPSLDTMTVQVVSTLSSLATAGAEVDLFLPVRPGAPPRDPADHLAELRDWYKRECGFSVRHVPSIWPGGRGVEKPLHAFLSATAATDIRYDALYTRLVLPVWSALRRQMPVLFETFRPLTRRYPWSKGLFRRAARRPDFLGVVTHSEYARTALVEDALPPDRVRTIYNGYDAGAFAHARTAREAREALGLPEAPTVAYLGRIAPHKRVDMLLDAAERLPGLRFVLAGADDTSESRPLVARGRSLPNVSFLGYCKGERIALALQAGDVLIVPPSDAPLAKTGNTVLPIKVFQYLAAGRPVICGDTPDTAEILVDDVVCVRTPPEAPAAFEAALAALMADAPRRERLGRAAADRARDLTWDARAHRLLAFLRERLDARAEALAGSAAPDGGSPP